MKARLVPWSLTLLALVLLTAPLQTLDSVVADGPTLTRHDPGASDPVLELSGSDSTTQAVPPPGGEIPITRWVSPDGSQPIRFAEWQARQPPPAPLHLEQIYLSEVSPSTADRLVYVLVNPSIYGGIAASLTQWTSDVESVGWSVAIYSASFPTPSDLRSYLSGIVDLGGCLLIGDFPVPWYELDVSGHEEFPVDLYYMDLDGIWTDADLDGLFDAHSGDTAPEIWVGRLTAGNLTIGGAGEVALLNNYFAKNHAYRTQSLLLPSRALMYVDDDWVPWALEWGEDLGLVYEDTITIYDPETTVAADYGDRLDDNYEWIQVCAHSWPGGHGFIYDGGMSWSWIYNYDIYDIDPHAFFYNLFACSGARYVETDYLGGWYIFVDTYGLAAVGSTKTGSMLGFDQFYGPLAQEMSLGEAFRDWFEVVGIYDQFWHYGMTLLGDPTLTTARRPEIEVSPSSYDEILSLGETITRQLSITNNGSAVLEFEIDETLLRTDIAWLSADPVSGTVPADSTAPVTVTFDASQVSVPGAYHARLEIHSNDPYTPTIAAPVTMTMVCPMLEITKGGAPDPVEAGDLLTYTLVVHNSGNGDATGATITDTIPDNTIFAWADEGGTQVGDQVQWADKVVAAGDELTVTFAVTVTTPLADGTTITNARYGVACAEGAGALGNPVTSTVWFRYRVYLPIVLKAKD